MMFVFLSVSTRCLIRSKLKKRKQIFLKQYAFQTKGSSAVGESLKQTLIRILFVVLIACAVVCLARYCILLLHTNGAVSAYVDRLNNELAPITNKST